MAVVWDLGGVISCIRWNWLDWYVWGKIANAGLLTRAQRSGSRSPFTYANVILFHLTHLSVCLSVCLLTTSHKNY